LPDTHYTMKELIEQLMKEAGLSEKQALEAIRIIKEFAKKKFPVFGGAIDKLFDKYAPKQEDDFMD
jgi:ribosomal protein L31E